MSFTTSSDTAQLFDRILTGLEGADIVRTQRYHDALRNCLFRKLYYYVESDVPGTRGSLDGLRPHQVQNYALRVLREKVHIPKESNLLLNGHRPI